MPDSLFRQQLIETLKVFDAKAFEGLPKTEAINVTWHVYIKRIETTRSYLMEYKIMKRMLEDYPVPIDWTRSNSLTLLLLSTNTEQYRAYIEHINNGSSTNEHTDPLIELLLEMLIGKNKGA